MYERVNAACFSALLPILCHAELAGDVPRPAGPHRAALSPGTDRETKGRCGLAQLIQSRVATLGTLCVALTPSSGGDILWVHSLN